MKLLLNSVASLLLLNAFVVYGKPRRISAQYLDLGEVHSIFMVPGMATIIDIPREVTGIRVGNPDNLAYFKPDKPNNEVTLVLKNTAAKPTNFILRSNKKIYVFDIIPSKHTHQDIVEILGDFGSPSSGDSNAKLIESSDSEVIGK
jgi:hypothetical protein